VAGPREMTSSTSLLLVVIVIVVMIFVFIFIFAFVIVSKLHSHFGVLDGFIGSFDGSGPVSAFVGFGLLQMFASFPQGL